MSGVYKFGSIEVDVAQRWLAINGQKTRIGARAFDVLSVLIERSGQLVTKNELLEAVWPQASVEQNNLVVQVGNLRKLLGSRIIVTIPGRGYQFAAALTESPDAPARGTSCDADALAGSVPAVLLLLLDRAEDLRAADAALRRHQLITLTGIGGIGEVARVVSALLTAAPQIRILVTSQIALGIESEQIYQVKPLAIPPATTFSPVEAMRFGTVALFHARASEADHRFVLNDENVCGVVDICRRLEGLPLAIEMAAASVRSLGVSTLAALVDHQLEILSAERRDLPQRQRTLRATVE